MKTDRKTAVKKGTWPRMPERKRITRRRSHRLVNAFHLFTWEWKDFWKT